MSFFKPLSLYRFWGVIGVAVLCSVIAAVLLPHDPYIRYQAMQGTIFERTKWFYERNHFDDTPIDILFLGSSRTARGVISPDLEASLQGSGVNRHVANFSLPASGLDIRQTLAADVLANRDVEMLVISLPEQFPRDGHQAFADLATTQEVLQSPWLVNRNLPENLARLPMRQLQLAIGSMMPSAFDYQSSFDTQTYAGTSVDPRIFNPGNPSSLKTAAEISALEKESAFRRRTLTRPILPEGLADIEFGVPRSYIRQLSALAQAHDTKLVFLYLPFFGGFEEPFEKEWLEQFGPVLSASFLREDPQNYNDVAHMSDHGAKILTTWLTDQLVPLLEQDN